ncbi:hypothetical protein [Rhodococcus daqingensis]|uniref:DUF333 domain-containing protein n=1 Tax=Rhodococcus daqingensis TaxID=2479363 RepID=A0ABW2RRL7_9NOCA
MSTNRITTALRTAAVAALIGLPALGFAGTAAAMHPGEHPPAVDPIVGTLGGQPCPGNRVGIDADTGEQLMCVYSPNGGIWVRTNGGIIGVHEWSSPCDPSTDNVSQTPEGKVVRCTPTKNQWLYGA